MEELLDAKVRPALRSAMTTTSTSAVPHIQRRGHEPRAQKRAVCQNSWRLLTSDEDPSGHRVHAAPRTTRAMTETTRMAVCDTFPASSRSVGPQIHDGQNEVGAQSTMMSHMSGDARLE